MKYDYFVNLKCFIYIYIVGTVEKNNPLIIPSTIFENNKETGDKMKISLTFLVLLRALILIIADKLSLHKLDLS